MNDDLSPEMQLFNAIEDYVARAVEPLYQRLEVHPDTLTLRVNEAVGKAMESVRMPADGKPGRDARDLEIIDGIEHGKSYPAGTFALHDGGTVLAVRDTDPIELGTEAAGWKVTQDGIKSVTAHSVDERTHRVIVTRTSGKAEAFNFTTSFANMDKGVHRPGMKYRAGDGVTRDLIDVRLEVDLAELQAKRTTQH
ncbi:MAG TPA: hypothetical protein VLI21_05405 [Casimicrobiaceae bacterium]|nr:hypothetical protein [Casimicrobiaceae bacterium]